MKNNETKMNIVAGILVLCVIVIFIIGHYNSNVIWVPVVIAFIALAWVGIPLLRQLRTDIKKL
jgi:uncharacterized membrane-anchored protein YjiN (DUF445 family)